MSNSIASQRVKARYLTEHPALIMSWPLGVRPCVPYPVLKHPTRPADPDPFNIRARWRVVVEALRRAGLVGRTTFTGDVRVPGLVALARYGDVTVECIGCPRSRCDVLHNLVNAETTSTEAHHENRPARRRRRHVQVGVEQSPRPAARRRVEKPEMALARRPAVH